MPGATVTITSVERKTADTVVTNESGIYLKERLLPGTYEVQSRARRASRPRSCPDHQGQRRHADAPQHQARGRGGQRVGHGRPAFSPVLKTDRADVATTFDSKQITDLPVLDRNFTKFILLTPGTQQLQWQHAASENPQGSTQTMVNGQHFSGTGYQLDGTENRDPILGIIVINPNFEAIGGDEDHVAELRRGVRPGDRRRRVGADASRARTTLHGSGFEFYQNDGSRRATRSRSPDRIR